MQEKVTATLTAHRINKLKNDEKLNKDGKFDSLPDSDLTATIVYDFGDDPMDAVEKFGERVVMSFITGHCLFGLQEKIRSLLQQGYSEDEIQDKIYNPNTNEHFWRPGEAPKRKSAIEKTADRLNKLDPEAREKEIEALRALLEQMED